MAGVRVELEQTDLPCRRRPAAHREDAADRRCGDDERSGNSQVDVTAALRGREARDALGRDLGRERRRHDDVDRPQQMGVPEPLDALELVLARIVEHGARARHELLDGARHHHLRGAGERGHPGADVHSDPAERAVDLLDLTGVDSAANVEADVLDRGGDLCRGAECLHRLCKGREEAVSLGALLTPATALQLVTNGGAEVRQDNPPVRVTEIMGQCSRVHDVEEQHRHQAAARTGARHGPIICHAAPPA